MDLITIIARRTKPAFMLVDIDVEAAEALRARLADQGTRVTITAILLKAISIAQLAHPRSRSYRLADGRLITEKEPVAGFTVERSVEGEPVVFFAIIPKAHSKSLAEIAQELENYGKAEIHAVPQLGKEVSLTKIPWLLRQVGIWVGMRLATLRRTVNPATFGLTSLGKFGMNAVLAPNVSTCIFGVGSTEDRAIVVKDNLQIRKMMTMSLAVDTNVMNMTSAALMLRDVKELLESGLANHLHESEQAIEIYQLPKKEVALKSSVA